MLRLETDGLPCWRARHSGHVVAFSTRLGGVSAPPFDSLNVGRSTDDRPGAVAENRRRFLAALGLDPHSIVTAGQVHGARIVRAESPGLHRDCDALLTTVPHLALAVTTADCVPLVYVAPGIVAVAHAGWRGAAAGLPSVALEAVCTARAVGPDRVHVYVGPSIRSCCYPVGPDVAGCFSETVRSLRGEVWHLDLVADVRRQLLHSGLPPGHIEDVAECTACTGHRYFSHRRDRGRTGRHWAVAACVPEAT